MNLSRFLPLVVGSATAGVLASMSPAQALTTWTLNSTTFDDGSYVTGSFNYDETNTNPISAAYTTVSIQLFNNTNTQLASYTLANLIPDSDADELLLGDGTYWVYIANSLSFWYDPGNSPISFFSTYGQSAAFGSNALGVNVSGTISASAAAVPFDIPGGATIPTLGSLFALALMRKAKKSIASQTRMAEPVETVVS